MTPQRPVPWSAGPLEILRRWPDGLPLTALVSAASSSRWSRWSILASPAQTVVIDDAAEAWAALGSLGKSAGRATVQTECPFAAGWIAALSYDMGRAVEPTAGARPGDGGYAVDDRRWPALILWRCPAALVHDGHNRRWFSIGADHLVQAIDVQTPQRDDGYVLDPINTTANRTAYVDAVASTIELIRAGDIFQANIAHRLTMGFEGNPRVLAAEMLRRANPWFGAFLEINGSGSELARTLISASPELFLSFDSSTRQVTTRPIKGTRQASIDPDELMHAAKDTAELTMIVDLMRNDLGRVCEYGSVRVVKPREIETHARLGDCEAGAVGGEGGEGGLGGVHHAVATVTGRLGSERSLVDLLRATFPPGSITGAPKVRAMQIIDAIEPVRRGPHFGAIGFISDSGHAQFNVAIRSASLHCEPGSTLTCARGTLDYLVGAGIVADSDPAAEWAETLDKAEVLTHVAAPLAGFR